MYFDSKKERVSPFVAWPKYQKMNPFQRSMVKWLRGSLLFLSKQVHLNREEMQAGEFRVSFSNSRVTYSSRLASGQSGIPVRDKQPRPQIRNPLQPN